MSSRREAVGQSSGSRLMTNICPPSLSVLTVLTAPGGELCLLGDRCVAASVAILPVLSAAVYSSYSPPQPSTALHSPLHLYSPLLPLYGLHSLSCSQLGAGWTYTRNSGMVCTFYPFVSFALSLSPTPSHSLQINIQNHTFIYAFTHTHAYTHKHI